MFQCQENVDCCNTYWCKKKFLYLNIGICTQKIEMNIEESLLKNYTNDNKLNYLDNKYSSNKNKTDQLSTKINNQEERKTISDEIENNLININNDLLSQQKMFVFSLNIGKKIFNINQKEPFRNPNQLDNYFKNDSLNRMESIKNLYFLFLKYQVLYVNSIHKVNSNNVVTMDKHNTSTMTNNLKNECNKKIPLIVINMIKEKIIILAEAFRSTQLKINEIINFIRNKHKRFPRSQVDHVELILNYIKTTTRDLNKKVHTTDYTYKECLNSMMSSLDKFKTTRNKLHKDYFLTEKSALRKLDKMEEEIKELIDKELENLKLNEKEPKKDKQKQNAFNTKMEVALKKLKTLVLRFYKRTKEVIERYRNTLAGVDLDATSKKGLLEALSRIK